mgnify:CR=1 FL=1
MNLAIGIAAGLATAMVGAGWQIATRHGVTGTLGPLELATLRLSIGAILLLPVTLRIGLVPRGRPRLLLAFMVLGGGLPFTLSGMIGAHYAPVAHMGILLAGTVPLFTALAWWLVARDALGPLRLVGFAFILAGVAAISWQSLSGDLGASWRGDLLFLLAAMLWAAYTVAFRSLKLSPWQGAALINTWSLLLLLPVLLVFGAPRLLTAPWSDLLMQAFWQGIVAGLLGLFVYGVTIARLGPANAALFGALVPVLSTFGGAIVLSEPLTMMTVIAAIAVASGVVLASGWRWRGKSGD